MPSHADLVHLCDIWITVSWCALFFVVFLWIVGILE